MGNHHDYSYRRHTPTARSRAALDIAIRAQPTRGAPRVTPLALATTQRYIEGWSEAKRGPACISRFNGGDRSFDLLLTLRKPGFRGRAFSNWSLAVTTSASSSRSSPQKISLPITNVGEPNIPSERAVSVSAWAMLTSSLISIGQIVELHILKY